MKEIAEYDYPKQIILNETEGTKIYKKLGKIENALEIDDYNCQVVTTIMEKDYNNERYTLIQHEDSRLGWIKLQDSIQIFRFEPVIARFIEDEFEANIINDKLGIIKDFHSHFTGRLLTIKSEIAYKDNQLLGVFVKDKFFGFHDKKFFETLEECDFSLSSNDISNKDLFKTSKMNEVSDEEILIQEPRLISIFKKSNIGKVKVNSSDYFWIYLDGLEYYKNQIQPFTFVKNSDQKEIDDLFYAVKKERKHSKEIVKTVLSLKDYMKTRNANGTLDYDIASNNELKKELTDLKKNIDKLNKQLKLSETRLEQQRDYNRRLEAQKDKYKNRMNLLEDKVKKLK